MFVNYFLFYNFNKKKKLFYFAKKKGDSGGPLVVRSTTGRWHLIGLTSYGSANCLDGGVYTRLSGFANWIKNIVTNY